MDRGKVRINLPLFSTVVPSNIYIYVSVNCPVTVNCPSQESEETSTPTRLVDNVVTTTKGLQDRNIHILDGTTVVSKR